MVETSGAYNKNAIGLLLPTRERPALLIKLLDSLENTIVNKKDTKLFIYIDDDDQQTLELLRSERLKKYTFDIHGTVAEKTSSMGDMLNNLCFVALQSCGIVGTICDDYTFVTPGWDNILRETVNSYPDRVLLAFPDDPISPNFPTFPLLTKEWIDITGQFLTNYFPFWYDDVWLDEIAQMVQRKVKVAYQVVPQDGKGKTPRLRDMIFWQNFFVNTIFERMDTAEKLRQVIGQNNLNQIENSRIAGMQLAQGFIQANTRSDEVLKQTEVDLGIGGAFKDSHALLTYRAAELRAVAVLLHLLNRLIKAKETDWIKKIISNIEHTAVKVEGLTELKASLGIS